MNEKLALLITQAKAARKTWEKNRFDSEYQDMIQAESALARWVVKHAHKLRSVE